MIELRYCEKKLIEFADIEDNCDEFSFDEYGDVVCEVGYNYGGNCYPWECPLCNCVDAVKEIVEKNMEVKNEYT